MDGASHCERRKREGREGKEGDKERKGKGKKEEKEERNRRKEGKKEVCCGLRNRVIVHPAVSGSAPLREQ